MTNMKEKIFLLGIISLLLFFQLGCSSGGGGSPGGGSEDAVIDVDAIYSGGYEEEDLLTFAQGGGYPDLQFPKNQLLIQTKETTSRDQFLALLNEIGGTLIGQIPSLHLYQVQVSSSSKEELDQFKETFKDRAEVARIAYNFICTQTGSLDFGSCPVMPDNKAMYPDDNDPLDNFSEYYTALEIVTGLRNSIPMDRVTIGLNEFGYNPNNGQFDDINIEVIEAPGPSAPPLDTGNTHGNAVAGIVCADNDGEHVNGIASSFLGDKLRVVIARPRNNDMHSNLCAMNQLAANADIVLNNFNFGLLSDEIFDVLESFDTCRYLLNQAFEGNPNVLFINAAPNLEEREGEDFTNFIPADIRLENTITVGAIVPNDPLQSSTPYRPIDIFAFGAGIFLVKPDGGVIFLEGSSENNCTSWALPQVASAAALLKSVGRNLSHSELKRYLLEYIGGEGFSGQEGVNGHDGVLLKYARPLIDLLWDKYRFKGWGFIMDLNENGIVDGPSSLAQTLCSDFNLRVDGIGDFYIDPEDQCLGTSFLLKEDGSVMQIGFGGFDEGNSLWGAFNIGTTATVPALFDVDLPYDIGEHSEEFFTTFAAHTDWQGDCGYEFEQPGDVSISGGPIAGTFEFTNCRVAERTSDGNPKYLFVDLALDCMLQLHVLNYPDEAETVTAPAKGWVRSISVVPLTPLGSFEDYIDQLCSE